MNRWGFLEVCLAALLFGVSIGLAYATWRITGGYWE